MTTQTHADEQRRLQRLDEAGQWLLRMQDPQRSDQELNDWLRWIDSDPANFAEFERLQCDWKDLDALKDEGRSHSPRQMHVPVGRHRLWALAAGLAALAVLAGTLLYPRSPPSTRAADMTAALTSRAATLPDGSQMILGAQSRVNMDFNGPSRQLDLSTGEAYFKVKHDTARPFVVHAGEISVTAIGTAFDVRRELEHVTITVEEGIVEVSSLAGGKRAATWRAEAGYQLTYSTRDRTASLASVDSAAALAWRDGELAYVREPLGIVVENLNRHSRRRIVIEDPEIAALPFTGTAFTSSVEDWLAGIEQAYPISATRTADGDIILSTRE